MKEFTCIVCPNGCRLRVEELDGEPHFPVIYCF